MTKRIMLDTNAYAAFKRGNKDLLLLIQRVDTIALCPIILGELISGFKGGNREELNKQELKQFLQISRVEIYPLLENTSSYYAHIYNRLKEKGRPIPTNDIWIAASALEHGCMLCTYDSDFQHIEDLIIVTSVNEVF